MTSLLPGDAIFRSQHHHFWIPRLFLHKNRSRNQFIHDTPIDTKNLELTPRTIAGTQIISNGYQPKDK